MFRGTLLAALILATPAFADDWPQWLGPRRDGIWRESGILDKFPPGGPKLVWKTPIGEGYAGPAVARGRVYITDRVLPGGNPSADDGFKKDRSEGNERVLCLDEASGKILWKHEYPTTYDISYPAGPRTTPVVSGDKVYTLGAMGHLFCFDADKGTVIWSKELRKEYQVPYIMWGFSGSPIVENDRLICLVGGKGSTCVAFDKNTGKELWKNLSAVEPGYAPPMIHEIDGKKMLILWHPQSINALDPTSGKVYWSFPFGGKGKMGSIKAGLTIPTPRLAGDLLFVTTFYDGPLLLKLNGLNPPTEVWRGHGRGEQPDQTDILHSIMPTPVIQDGTIYGIDSYGELRGIDLKSGKRLWETHAATGGKSLRWANAFLTPQGDRFFLFNELGELIIAKLSPKGYHEIDRATILEPTNRMAGPKGRRVIWSHPAFADRSIFARNDREIVRYSLAKE
jgi:outer membrane protein assembly factor BamB